MVAELWWHVKLGGQATHFHKNMPVISVSSVSRYSQVAVLVDGVSRLCQSVVSVRGQSIISVGGFSRWFQCR